jgi:FkbM family methyltransferase
MTGSDNHNATFDQSVSEPAPAVDIGYEIGKFVIRLPHDHLLPVYQARFPQYDRFLPHLARFLPNNSIVIDVGANCADTLAGMADKNETLDFLCIEADQFFYQYLSVNAEVIKNTNPVSQIVLVNCLVGSEVTNVVMAGGGGTKKAVYSHDPNQDAIQSASLDSILEITNAQVERISLVKVDTDGYDYDVLNSSFHLLERRQPLLFFEAHFSDDHQLAKYKELITAIEKFGYTNWTVFDNFGGLMLSEAAPNQVNDLLDYVWRQNQNQSNRTIYYIDILVGVERDKNLIHAACQYY